MISTALELRLVAQDDAPELLAFENRNRTFFESWVNARPAEFYSEAGVALAIAHAQKMAAQDQAYQYLVRDASGLIGRVNLTQVKREHYQAATLGYRVGQEMNGKGYAKAMVAAALQRAFGEHHLARIEATARPENLASAHVLRANGFTQFGHSKRCFTLHGVCYDLLYFEAHAR